jgi:uncharacterized protein YggE
MTAKNMSTDYNNVKSKRNTKFAIVAGILALGILAAALTGSQMLNATAQTTSDDVSNSTRNAINVDNNNNKLYPMPPYYHGSSGEASTVSTSGSGTTKVTPDKFSVTVGVETNGTTADEAASKNADLMAKVIAALKGLGIKEDQIGTSNYNVYPVYDFSQPTKACPEIYPVPPYCQPSQAITGYRASNSVTVTLDAQGNIDAGKVIDESVKAGANNVYGVYFFISTERQQEIRDGLIKDAIANARHRADVAASALGVQISGVQSASLNDVYFPIYSKSYEAGMTADRAITPIMPGEQEISTSVSVVFYISNIMTDNNGSQSGNEASTSPGMLKTKDNTNCTNPSNGPMIC